MSDATAEDHLSGGANSEALVDPERLTYVTRVLGGQQGLYMVLLGALFLFPKLAHIWNGWLAELVASLVMFAVLLAAYHRYIPRYYGRRFGYVEPQQPSNRQVAISFLVLLALIFFGQPIAHFAGPKISDLVGRIQPIIPSFAHQINSWPIFFWIGLFLSSLRWHPRRIERQRLYFFLVGLLVWASIVLCPVWDASVRQFELWKVVDAGWIGISLIALGLYDHIVLVRTLPKRVVEDNDE